MSDKKRAWSGDFRAYGLVEPPRSQAEFRGVIAARETLEKLRCFIEAREKMALGQSRRQVADFIQNDQKECITMSLGTMMAYVGLYRKFVMPPIEFVREPAPPSPAPETTFIPAERSVSRQSNMANPMNGLAAKVTRLHEGVEEADVLARMIHLQEGRITRALALEQTLGGWLTNTISGELRILKELAVELRNIKSDLMGYQERGYQRAPKSLNMTVQNLPPFNWSDVNEEERAVLLAFGTKLDNLMLKAPEEKKEEQPAAV